MRRHAAAVVAVVSFVVGCTGTADTVVDAPTTTVPVTSATPSSSSTTTAPTSSTTMVPDPACDPRAVYDTVDDMIGLARLTTGVGWSTDLLSERFLTRTNSPSAFAERLALDCGVAAATAGDAPDRLLLAAWTGPRMVFVLQAADSPAEPYALQAVVTILTEDPKGEFLLDDQSVWAATLDGGETLVLGHVDYNLGATAKAWQAAVPPPPDAEPTLESQQHAIDVLRAAGARHVAIAQPAEFGSREGLVMFVSPSGQILVVDAAPISDLDPLEPRYLQGSSTVDIIEGIEVRFTEAEPDEFYAVAAEVGWQCGDFGWILEPPLNGTGAEMLEFATSVIRAGVCDPS